MKPGKVLHLASLNTNIVLSHYFVACETRCFSIESESQGAKIQLIMSWQVALASTRLYT